MTQETLFADVERIVLPDDNYLIYEPQAFSMHASQWFQQLLEQTPWQQDSIVIAGRSIKIPRMQAWYGDYKTVYTYSGLTLKPLAWTPLLSKIKQLVEEKSGCGFNSVLVNYYRDGDDSVSWHADDEKELGDKPIIASVSLGCERFFSIRSKDKGRPATHLPLGNGAFLLMGPGVQESCEHAVLKQKEIDAARISLTFRQIYHHD